jgi:hypothetical protein
MDKIKRQVSVAHRRMVTQRFLGIVTWSLFATLLAAALGMAAPKIWPLDIESIVWARIWIGGGLGAGLLLAGVWTYFVRRSPLDAAIEIDRRFHLQERISSALSLGSDAAQTEAGRALLEDAVRRVDRIDVRDHFPVTFGWRNLLPLLPAALIFVLVALVPDAVPEPVVAADRQAEQDSEAVKRSAEALQKRLERARKEAEEQGLEDADLLFKRIQNGLEELASRSDVDKKKALVKINDLAQTIEQRRQQFGGVDQMRDKLNQLKDLKQGPADKIARAMQDGDFAKALDELKNLQDKLRDDKLTADEKQQLAEQLVDLQKKLQDMVDAHQQAKRDLQDEIERRKAAGDLHEAGKLQRQLDQLNQMNDQMDQLQKMADNLGQCRNCVQNGDLQQAAGQLDQLADSLQEMQEQLEQLETLNEMLDEIAMAKEAMNCDLCNGQGCKACMGAMFGQGAGQGRGRGMGLGEGQGQGDRPEERTDTNFYESQVRGEVQAGEAVRTGTAGGPNRAGQTLEEVKEQLRSTTSQDADPLVDVRLPRKQRDHARQYLNRIRTGD